MMRSITSPVVKSYNALDLTRSVWAEYTFQSDKHSIVVENKGGLLEISGPNSQSYGNDSTCFKHNTDNNYVDSADRNGQTVPFPWR